jgi:hypothetical protein
MKHLPILALAVLLGCGGSNNNVVPPENLVAGTWRFTYTNLTGSIQGLGVSCAPVSFDFSITQGLFDFSGVQVGTGTVTCSTNAAPIVNQAITGETIVQGKIDGRSIRFAFGTMGGLQTGIVGQTTITGTAQWVLVANSVTLILNGQFTATRL